MMNESFVDYLTGLSNRRGLYDYYNSLPENSFLHAIYLDVDNFKRVNDIFGHSTGDEFLVKVSSMLKETTNGFCCRMGGDEFVVLLSAEIQKSDVEKLAVQYKNSLLNLDFRSDILSLVSFSIGIVFNQSVLQPLDDMLFKCDTAMYQAKYDGKNQYRIYSESDKKMQLQKSIELEMEAALNQGQFKLYLQPEINMVTSQIYCVEAFSRWEHPSDGIRLPEEYIPVFEKNGFVAKLNLYLFEELCKVKASWKNTELEHLPVSVNFSRLNLYDNSFVKTLVDIAFKYQIPTKEITVEFKESIYVKDKDALSSFFKNLASYDFKYSIDDFGLEYATLKLLSDMPADNIKLSPSFIYESFKTDRGKNLLKNVINLCLAMRQEVIAVGIENKEQADFILDCGCQVAQGNFFSEVFPVFKITDCLKKYSLYKNNSYYFSLDGNLFSSDKTLEGKFTGPEKPLFTEGIYENSKALEFTGGKILENVVILPNEVLQSDSYTITMWIYPKEPHLYTSAFFAHYASGFTSIMPLAWEANSAFRIHLVSRPMEWFDTSACMLPPDTWTMFSVSFNAVSGRMVVFINNMPLKDIYDAPIQRNLKQLVLGGDMFQDSFKGKICDLRIYNEVKDYQFIKDLYDSTVAQKGFTKNHTN